MSVLVTIDKLGIKIQKRLGTSRVSRIWEPHELALGQAVRIDSERVRVDDLLVDLFFRKSFGRAPDVKALSAAVNDGDDWIALIQEMADDARL